MTLYCSVESELEQQGGFSTAKLNERNDVVSEGAVERREWEFRERKWRQVPGRRTGEKRKIAGIFAGGFSYLAGEEPFHHRRRSPIWFGTVSMPELWCRRLGCESSDSNIGLVDVMGLFVHFQLSSFQPRLIWATDWASPKFSEGPKLKTHASCFGHSLLFHEPRLTRLMLPSFYKEKKNIEVRSLFSICSEIEDMCCNWF